MPGAAAEPHYDSMQFGHMLRAAGRIVGGACVPLHVVQGHMHEDLGLPKYTYFLLVCCPCSWMLPTLMVVLFY